MKEKVGKTSVVIVETPQPTKKKIAEVKEMTHKQSANKLVQRRLTRSQIAKEKGKAVISGVTNSPSLKGNLDDILQAIDIEESPLVQADFIKVDEGK